MALYKEWNPDIHSLAAIWKIEEVDTFFVQSTGVDAAWIKHEKKRLEHLCGRHLLQLLKHDFPLHHIAPDEHDKPRIPADRYRFSISHSYPYVAAQVSDVRECGVDIQTWHRSMATLEDKFLSVSEQELFAHNVAYMHLAWCAKEAAYKWNGRRGIDFIKDMKINLFIPGEQEYDIRLSLYNEGIVRELYILGFLHDDFALALVQ